MKPQNKINISIDMIYSLADKFSKVYKSCINEDQRKVAHQFHKLCLQEIFSNIDDTQDSIRHCSYFFQRVDFLLKENDNEEDRDGMWSSWMWKINLGYEQF